MALPYDHRMTQPMIKTTVIAALTLAALATEASPGTSGTGSGVVDRRRAQHHDGMTLDDNDGLPAENHLRRNARIRRGATGARSPARVSGAGQTALTWRVNLRPWRGPPPVRTASAIASPAMPGPLLSRPYPAPPAPTPLPTTSPPPAPLHASGSPAAAADWRDRRSKRTSSVRPSGKRTSKLP